MYEIRELPHKEMFVLTMRGRGKGLTNKQALDWLDKAISVLIRERGRVLDTLIQEGIE